MRLLREPILHFVVIGTLLFVLDARRGESEVGPTDDLRQAVVVTPTIRDELGAALTTQLGREATDEELEALIGEWIVQEALVLEAQSLGLHDNDPIIRRRLEQNMRFLLEDADAVQPVDETSVDAWIAENLPEPERRVRIDLEHVYFSTDRHGDAAASLAVSELATLRAAADPVGRGDAFLRGRQFTNVGINELARVFGTEFAEAAVRLEADVWSEPLASPYGQHVVRVRDRRVPPAGGSAAERDAGRRAIERERRAAVNAEAVQQVVDRYPVQRDDQ